MKIENREFGNFSHVCVKAPKKSPYSLKKINVHLTNEVIELLDAKTIGSRNLCASQLIVFALKQLDLTNKVIVF